MTMSADRVGERAAPAPVTLAISGWGVMGAGVIGTDRFARSMGAPPVGPSVVTGMFDDPVPSDRAYALRDFAVRDHLGRKGTSTYDRSTALSVVACKLALADSDLAVTDENRERIGIVLGTTAGSVKSTSDYSRESLTQERPYLVNPLLFPNAVMNCAASQAAIRYGLKGINATLAAGELAAVGVLRYARTLIRAGYADALLTGAVEEFSPHSAWATHFAMEKAGATTLNGEGAAVFVVEDAVEVRRAGRGMDAEILAAEFGQFAPPEEAPNNMRVGLRACVERALQRAGVRPTEVWAVSSAENGEPALDALEDATVREMFGHAVERIRVKEWTGECYSASSAFQLAALLGRHRIEPALDGRTSVVTCRAASGSVGAVVLRGWSRPERTDDN